MLEILHALIFIVSIIGGAIIIVTLILGVNYASNVEKKSASERSDEDSNERSQ